MVDPRQPRKPQPHLWAKRCSVFAVRSTQKFSISPSHSAPVHQLCSWDHSRPAPAPTMCGLLEGGEPTKAAERYKNKTGYRGNRCQSWQVSACSPHRY